MNIKVLLTCSKIRGIVKPKPGAANFPIDLSSFPGYFIAK